MILLKEQFVALIFSLLCFVIALITGLASGADLFVVCVRAAIAAIIGYAVGLVFGLVIKNLFLETLVPPPKKEKEEGEIEKKAVPIDAEKT